ncbi:CocE/NonD family hydrolase [Actinacidiphila sp. DG2A-62]|nr:CocE/NonD family hydrolase [Actinacidiphila sp. DG2A-62]MEC3997097.1 CocE/NonD family hydrolase [Actinacidiphila sp. DG2A-62]
MSLYIETNVAVPMRDGVTLATDLWRPAGIGPWPVLLARTPYGRTGLDPL